MTDNALTPWQNRVIDCVVDIAAMEPEGEHISSHWLFIRKVLGEKTHALPMAAAFRHVKLTREKCVEVATGRDDE